MQYSLQYQSAFSPSLWPFSAQCKRGITGRRNFRSGAVRSRGGIYQKWLNQL